MTSSRRSTRSGGRSRPPSPTGAGPGPRSIGGCHAGRRLENLLVHADSLPSLNNIRDQVAAICDQRSLLSNPDPVTPLLNTVADALRTAVRTAREETERVRLREVATLEGTPEWDQLSDDQWQRIFSHQGLLPVPEPKGWDRR